jgi:hypothetical protein
VQAKDAVARAVQRHASTFQNLRSYALSFAQYTEKQVVRANRRMEKAVCLIGRQDQGGLQPRCVRLMRGYEGSAADDQIRFGADGIGPDVKLTQNHQCRSILDLDEPKEQVFLTDVGGPAIPRLCLRPLEYGPGGAGPASSAFVHRIHWSRPMAIFFLGSRRRWR